MNPVDPEDQVPRLQYYQARHPHVRFTPPCNHDPMWRARWRVLGDDRTTEVTANELADLMDQLEGMEQQDRAS